MNFGLHNLSFWELYRRVSYRLHEKDTHQFYNGDRNPLRDFYLIELELAYYRFRNNPVFSDKLPDDRCDPTIGLRKIDNICHQALELKLTGDESQNSPKGIRTP